MIFHDPHNQGLETFRNLITLLASPGHPTFDWFECDLGSRHRQTIPVPCSGSPSGLPFAPLKSLHLKLLQASLADAPHTVSVYSPSIASKASMHLMISSLSKQNIAKSASLWQWAPCTQQGVCDSWATLLAAAQPMLMSHKQPQRACRM